ncbi:MAG: PRC-barrel domain-containing protein [Syntrophomonadaceae bacterium]|nr:PRC-barrel domain-containing protein [Syntrophomonadaceae bacterium]
MVKGRELLGRPVVELGSGRQVGVVEDLLLALNPARVRALKVKTGNLLETGRMLDFRAIHRIGPEAVTFLEERAEELTVEEEGNDSLRIREIKGQRAISEAGEELGTMEDAEIDPNSGQVICWELSGGLIQDLLDGRKTLFTGAVAAYGKDRVIIREGVG